MLELPRCKRLATPLIPDFEVLAPPEPAGQEESLAEFSVDQPPTILHVLLQLPETHAMSLHGEVRFPPSLLPHLLPTHVHMSEINSIILPELQCHRLSQQTPCLEGIPRSVVSKVLRLT